MLPVQVPANTVGILFDGGLEVTGGDVEGAADGVAEDVADAEAVGVGTAGAGPSARVPRPGTFESQPARTTTQPASTQPTARRVLTARIDNSVPT
jgi:hypothetical protein